MNVLVIGQGGREHALVHSLKKSSKIDRIYCAPGNGGIEQDATCLPIKENNFEELVDAVKQLNIDFTVVGPEQPLLDGIVDYFQSRGLAIIGPTKNAARIEGSKSFAKELMEKYNIPTADYQIFDDKDQAIAYVRGKGVPVVIKADGLAAGKGVVVAHKMEEAIEAITSIMADKVFGNAGNTVVIEEFLQGEELTVLAFVDGHSVVLMEPAQDHKPIYDGDQGPNTGGMGAYSPVPHIDNELLKKIKKEIIVPTIEALKAEGIVYKGILYTGLMLTDDGPKVIEYNAHFGDPETQAILPRLKTDIVDVFEAVIEEKLNNLNLEWDQRPAICVIMASKGYPGKYDKGIPIFLNKLKDKEELINVEIYFAGAIRVEDQLVTSGGRVLGLTSLGNSIEEAKKLAYKGIKEITFQGAQFRNDIAEKAIKAKTN